MNLSAYDEIHPKVDKKLTWINVDRYQLLSREITHRMFNTLCKRYNREENDYDYFIILLDDKPSDRNYAVTKFDDYGRIKISLKPIWKEAYLDKYKHDVNISITRVEHTDDGDIYKLNL